MDLTPLQMDAVVELMNIGIGKAASTLNQLVNTHVTLTVPSVRVMTSEQARQELGQAAKERVSAVQLSFSGKLSGSTAIFFSPENALKLANVLVGGDQDNQDMDSLKIGTLIEVGNILLNGVVGSISNIIGEHVGFSVPTYEEGIAHEIMTATLSGSDKIVVLAETKFSIEKHHLQGETIALLEMESFAMLLEAIDKMIASRPGDRVE